MLREPSKLAFAPGKSGSPKPGFGHVKAIQTAETIQSSLCTEDSFSSTEPFYMRFDAFRLNHEHILRAHESKMEIPGD